MSRDNKQENSFGQQRDEWRRAYVEAHSVRERFPKVEQLVIEMAFTDQKGIGSYSAQMRSFSASAKAFFAFACPRTLCLHGGFDLDSVIQTLLHANQTTSVGILECHGWVHPDRTQNARCMLQMHYRLQVLYEGPKVSSSNNSGRRTRA